jgi:hypothetical protein
MANLEWTEVKDRVIATPKSGVIVTACISNGMATWKILVDGAVKMHGVCRDLSAAKDIAAKEVGAYLRG